MIKRINLVEARPGDILTFKGHGFLYEVLSRIIKLKVPTWNREEWHTAPLVRPGIIMDAEWPRLKLSPITDWPANEIKVYRINETPPTQEQLDDFIKDVEGCRYDWLVYILTALAILLRPKIDFPRIINRSYDCWETAWEFADYINSDITHDYTYPFLTDMIHLAGEC